MSTSNPRPLLPKVDEGLHRNPETTTIVTPRKHVVLACTACKKRKTKCDGQGPPCSMCSRKSTSCEYVEAQARMDQLKRDNAELIRKIDQYGALLAVLRSGTQEESRDILYRLRQGPTVEDLLETIESGKLLLSPLAHSSATAQLHSPPSNHFQSPARPHPRSPTAPSNNSGPIRSDSIKRKIDAVQPVDGEISYLPYRAIAPRSERGTSFNSRRQSRDQALDRLSVSFLTSGGNSNTTGGAGAVGGISSSTYPTTTLYPNAADWTTVTDDNALVSYLISLWFSAYHPSFRFIDKELFASSFSSGPAFTGSGFCSTLLVNCICASACHISDRIRGKSTPWHDDFVGKKFLQEALTLWREEEGSESLVNLQSATILCDVVSHNGEDKKGMSFLLTACQLARGQGLLRDPETWGLEQYRDSRTAAQQRRARAAAAWGLFQYQSGVCYSLNRFPLIRRAPIVEIPEQVDDDGGIGNILFRAECQLAVILNELGTMHFSDDDGYAGCTTSVEKTEDIYQRLLLFKDQLPHRITGEPDGDPATLLLQIQIQYVIVSLFSPYTDTSRLDLGQRFYTTRSTVESRAAVASLRQLLNLWTYCFGFSRCPYHVSHILLFDGLTALDELKTAQSTNSAAPTDAYTGLMSSIIALGAMSQRFVICEGKLKALKVKSMEIGVHLSARARQALAVVDQPGWTTKATAHFRSGIPVFLPSASVNTPDSVRLDHLLKTWSLTDEEHERSSQTSSLSDVGVDGR